MIFPTAYIIRTWSRPKDNELFLSVKTGQGQKDLNIALIRFVLDFESAENKIIIYIKKRDPRNYGIISELIAKFTAKDPDNYKDLIFCNMQDVIIHDTDKLVTTEQASKIMDDFIAALFEPDLRNALLPIHTEALSKLQTDFMEINYKMPPLVTSSWVKTLFAGGSVAKEARDSELNYRNGTNANETKNSP